MAGNLLAAAPGSVAVPKPSIFRTAIIESATNSWLQVVLALLLSRIFKCFCFARKCCSRMTLRLTLDLRWKRVCGGGALADGVGGTCGVEEFSPPEPVLHVPTDLPK